MWDGLPVEDHSMGVVPLEADQPDWEPLGKAMVRTGQELTAAGLAAHMDWQVVDGFQQAAAA